MIAERTDHHPTVAMANAGSSARSVADRLLGAGVALVAHSGEHSVGLEAHDTRTRRGLFDDGDRLTHAQERTRAARQAATASTDEMMPSAMWTMRNAIE